jgi:hypothetical protein
VFVARLDPAGTFVSVEKAGGPGAADTACSLAQDSAASLYVSGFFDDTATFGGTTFTSRGDWDAFVWKRLAL